MEGEAFRSLPGLEPPMLLSAISIGKNPPFDVNVVIEVPIGGASEGWGRPERTEPGGLGGVGW